MNFQLTVKENKFQVKIFISRMSRYPYTRHFCWTLKDLDDYPSIDRRKLKRIDVEFHAKVRYWASYNHLQDYKIYGTMIRMFCPYYLNSLQHPRDNPWPTHLINQNYRMRFHRQCDYLFKFQAERRINKSLLLQNWSKNAFDIEDNEYETLVLAYNKELDSLILANYITRSLKEEESSPPHIEYVVMDSEEETKNMLPTLSQYIRIVYKHL